jgi:hypothetical protein
VLRAGTAALMTVRALIRPMPLANFSYQLDLLVVCLDLKRLLRVHVHQFHRVRPPIVDRLDAVDVVCWRLEHQPKRCCVMLVRV